MKLATFLKKSSKLKGFVSTLRENNSFVFTNPKHSVRITYEFWVSCTDPDDRVQGLNLTEGYFTIQIGESTYYTNLIEFKIIYEFMEWLTEARANVKVQAEIQRLANTQ